jgi:hypothetical protein
VHPTSGETFSFPWKRSQNEQIKDFVDAMPVFDQLRQTLFSCLNQFDYINNFIVIFKSEPDSPKNPTKISILRVRFQVLQKLLYSLDDFENGQNFKRHS